MSSKVDLKVVLLGKEGGGKTSLVERFLHNRFLSVHQATVGAAFGAKKVEVEPGSVEGDAPGEARDGGFVTLGVWDTAGSERYEAMSRIYYRGAGAAIVCYDITDVVSFERAKFWVTELLANEENCRIYVCGTKRDLVASNRSERAVDYHTAQEWAEDINARFFETSSKDGYNTDEVFTTIARDYLYSDQYKQKKSEEEAAGGTLSSFGLNLSGENKNSCCVIL
eukprot:Nk52_evm19s2474 gene=Nk52_evmTU19s2474